MKRIAKVILPIALDKEFDYSFSSDSKIKIGMRVLVDFNRKKRIGLVVSIVQSSKVSKLKPIIASLDEKPLLDPEQIRFAAELSGIYTYPKAQFLFMMLPPYLKTIRKSDLKLIEKTSEPRLKAQEKGGSSQKASLGGFEVTFVKADNFTQRYQQWKRLVKDKLVEGSVLICFPQLTYLDNARKILEKDFPQNIITIHSQQTQRELFLNWQKSREKSLIIGTRTALFFYPSDIKLIVVEEENSPYYFQEEKPFYHLPDVAMALSKDKSIELMFCADYPSLRTYKYVEDKKIILKDLSKCSKNIEVVNIAEFSRRKIINPIFTELLRKAIEENKRAVILWNKKGFGRSISCSGCSHPLKCERCSAFLQLSLKNNEGVCPYCQKKIEIPQICPKCNNGYFKSSGFGIERLTLSLKRMFPEAKIDNWQNHTANSQIIISTSKILSSLYEPKVFDLGFVLDADFFLMRSDFNTTFDTFLYIKKLALLFKQSLYVFTSNKNYYLFKCLNEHWEEFYRKELSFRKEVNLPPFGLVAKVTLREKNENKLLEKANDLYNRLEKKGQDVYGPFQDHPFKLRDKFRYYIIVKGPRDSLGPRAIKEEIDSLRTSNLRIAVSLH